MNHVSRMEKESLEDIPVTELLKELHTCTDCLRKEELQQHLEKYGYKEIDEKKVNPFFKFLHYLGGPIPVITMIAAIMSAGLQQWTVAVVLAVTIIVVYGLFMTSPGWKWTGFVWAYALSWFLVNDMAKLAACRLFNGEHSGLFVRHARNNP